MPNVYQFEHQVSSHIMVHTYNLISGHIDCNVDELPIVFMSPPLSKHFHS